MHEPELVRLTQPEAAEVLERTGTVVIATGSVEQHGPHLPFGTDTIAAEAIARRVAGGLDALLVPATPLGVTPFHLGFAGTVSLRPETFVRILEDVCGSVIRHGARRIVIVNWHEGNTNAINTAVASLQQVHEAAQFIVAQACYIALELFGAEVGLTHGGELEVLPVLAHDQSLVHLDRAVNASDWAPARRMDALRRGKGVYPVLRDVRELAPTGWYGVIREVTPDQGERLVASVAEAIVERVRDAFAFIAERREGVGR